MTETLHLSTPDGRSVDVWLAAHVGHARAHLFPEHGRLTLVVDTYPRILDALIGGPA